MDVLYEVPAGHSSHERDRLTEVELPFGHGTHKEEEAIHAVPGSHGTQRVAALSTSACSPCGHEEHTMSPTSSLY